MGAATRCGRCADCACKLLRDAQASATGASAGSMYAAASLMKIARAA